MEEIVAYKSVEVNNVKVWHNVGNAIDFPENGGVCVYYNGLQIAVFNFSRRNQWYATQNICPHKNQMILSRGIIGTELGEPKVACPFHKKRFSLKTGESLSGDTCNLATYPVKVENGQVLVGVPF